MNFPDNYGHLPQNALDNHLVGTICLICFESECLLREYVNDWLKILSTFLPLMFHPKEKRSNNLSIKNATPYVYTPAI